MNKNNRSVAGTAKKPNKTNNSPEQFEQVDFHLVELIFRRGRYLTYHLSRARRPVLLEDFVELVEIVQQRVFDVRVDALKKQLNVVKTKNKK